MSAGAAPHLDVQAATAAGRSTPSRTRAAARAMDELTATRYAAGRTLRAIAREMGVSHERIRQRLARLGVVRRPRGVRPGRPPVGALPPIGQE